MELSRYLEKKKKTVSQWIQEEQCDSTVESVLKHSLSLGLSVNLVTLKKIKDIQEACEKILLHKLKYSLLL